jgi:cobalt-zinc-cadmium efflux system membrane fusion protein
MAASLSLAMLAGCKREPNASEHGHGPSAAPHAHHEATEHERHGESEAEHEHRDEHGDEHRGDQQGGHEAHARQRLVRVSKAAIKRSGIRVAQVLAVPATGGIEVPAEVQAEPDRLAHVSSVVSGQLARVIVSVGDRVQAGQTLAVIRSVALGEARAQAARAQANVEMAAANLRRQQELQREGIGAARQFLEAQAELKRAEAEESAAKRALEVYGRGGSGSEVMIKSPIAGRVVARHATVGEVVDPTDILFEITDITRVWVVGRVYQQQAGSVHEEASTVLTLQAHPGRTFEGKLDYVAPSLDERTRTLPVRVALDNPDGVLRPGLFGTLSISPSGTTGRTVAAVAAAAVQRLGNDTVVFVPGAREGEFEAVTVVTAPHTGDLVRIEKGVAVSDPYVAEGAFVLKSELSRGELGEGHAH